MAVGRTFDLGPPPLHLFFIGKNKSDSILYLFLFVFFFYFNLCILFGEGNGNSSTLAWKIPWTEEPGRLQSMGSLRVGHD